MVYNVIGIMSGSSLDGLDIAYVQLEEIRGNWTYQIHNADCIPYTADWEKHLRHAAQVSVPEYLKLNTAYGRHIGEAINTFIHTHSLEHKVHFIASHGHTVFHEPANLTSTQIGDGATIAAITSLPVVSDLRSLDIALGGQGAPIVPIGDRLLFPQYDYRLNIGGIANITVPHGDDVLAFDICPANQILNNLAEKADKQMDENGDMARAGDLLLDVLSRLNEKPYYQTPAPKSLSNEAAVSLVFPTLLESTHSVPDMLHTATQHIADQVAAAIQQYPTGKEQTSLLITGGGAFNGFLVERIREALTPANVQVYIPDETTIKFKEALVMALIGTLRWREETNVLSTVTGASRDSIGGALWMGHSY